MKRLVLILAVVFGFGALWAETNAAPLKVAVYADKGPSGIGALEWFRLVNDSPDMELKLVDGAAVRAGALAGQDLFIMPGGSSSSEYNSLGTNGVAKMKDFIREGGGYVGTCAGCCLMMDGPKRARVMPWSSRGTEKDLFYPLVKVNEAGAKALGIRAGVHKMRFHGGPLMRPTTNAIEGASFELWGTVDGEFTYRGKLAHQKQHYGAAAIVGGTYGKGRVFVTSMHPEYYESMHYLVIAAIRYATGRTVALPRPQRRRGDLAVGLLPRLGSVANAEWSLKLAAVEGIDLQVVNGDDIWLDRLAHLDVLVSPNEISKKDTGRTAAIKRFVARGGVLLVPKDLPWLNGETVCKDSEEMLEKVKELAGKR